MIRILFLCLLAMLISNMDNASAATKGLKVAFSSSDKTGLFGYLFRPKGAAPFPGIIAMHGCGGLYAPKGKSLAQARTDWAKRFVKAGYAVLFVDTYTPRKTGSQCGYKLGSSPIKLRHHVADLTGAAKWLAKQPYIDGARIGFIGWGVGGTAILRALAPGILNFHELNPKAAFAFYPQCKWLAKAAKYTPRLLPTIHMGAADDWVSPEPCQALATRWGSPIALYPGAYHNFDVAGTKVRLRKTGAGRIHAGPNPAARAKAIKAVMDDLAKAFSDQ